MSNKNKALTALKRKKFNTGSVAGRGGGPGSPGYTGPVVNPLDDIKIDDPAKNSLAIQPEPFEVTAATAQKIDTGFDPGAMEKAFAEKGNIRSATYNKETGLYDYVDVKGRAVSGKTPEEMLRFTNATTLNPFSTMQTQSGDVSKLATGTDAVTTNAAIGASATKGTATDSKAATAVMGDKVVDHAGIIQDAMDRQPLFGNPPKKMMEYSYDEESGEYVIDNAGWGFEGDARFTRLSPEEFYDKMGINSNRFTTTTAPKAATASAYTADKVEESDFVTASGAERDKDPITGLPIEPTKAEAGQATLTERADAAERDSFEETLAKGTAAQRPTEEPRILNDKQAKLEYRQSEAGRGVYTAKAQAEQQYANKERSIREQIRRAATPEERDKLNDELVANSRNRSKMLSDFNLAVKEGAALTKQNAASGIKQYAEGVTTAQTQQVADVAGPAVTTSEGVTISADDITKLKLEADKRGVGVEELKEYQDLIATKDRTEQSGTAATRVDPVTGQPISQALDVTEEGLPTAEAATAAFVASDYTPDGGNTTIDNTPAYKKAASREAAVGTAAARTAAELGNVPSVDLEGREAITGTAPQGDASQIGGVPTMAASKCKLLQAKKEE